MIIKLIDSRHFSKRKEKKRASENIQYMCEKIAKQQYNIDLPDDELFYFNVKEDSEGNVLIQDGSKIRHAHVMIT